MTLRARFAATLAIVSMSACSGQSAELPQPQAPVCGYTVVNSFPHDPEAYTQGLVYRQGVLYESTGLHGFSSIRRVDLESGAVEQIRELGSDYFGEGMTLVNDELVQITWQARIAFRYDKTSFEPAGQFTYTGPGWGLTDGTGRFIMSDGTSTLTFRDPDTFAATGSIAVHDGANPVPYLNELEYIGGEVLANVYTSDRIARVNPWTGEVIAWIDLTGILDPSPPTADVLNGIAYDADTGRLFVTGKRWPTLFEIELTGCPELAMFADGLESGDTLGWSRTVP